MDVDELSISQQAGQVIMVALGGHGVSGANDNTVLDTTEATAALIAELGIGGVCYFPFTPAFDAPEFVAGELARLQSVAMDATGIALLAATDQEGGRVRRLRRGFTELPAARELGADPQRVRAMAQTSGAELLQAGFNLVFAPVADVDSNPDNPVIADRSYGADPDQVAAAVTAAIEGFHAAPGPDATTGIACTVKHFPGHGDTAVDSHRELPVVERSLEHWWRLEAVPFVAAVAAGVDAVMLGHLVFPAIAADPATTSRDVVRLLRRELGFSGLVVTDALEMRGATGGGVRDAGSLAVASLAAGVDLLVMPDDPRAAHAAVVAAVEAGDVAPQRLREACQRVLAVKASAGPR